MDSIVKNGVWSSADTVRPVEVAMAEMDHRVRGVDHVAFPTFDPAATVRFYRDVLGFPVVHSICAAGWGPEDHPDFIHFFFDIGNDDRIAFFYYGRFGPDVPDLIDYGQVGFGRLTTPEAWLSTWSGLSSKAGFVRCAPGVAAPTLFVELTGDQAAFPADSRRMIDALGPDDLTTATVRGLRFGGAIAEGEPTGNELAAEEIRGWLDKRFPLAPPT
jgi:catechol 2,3-dioxygenase-like lactoylglutathione lyase family enzyme